MIIQRLFSKKLWSMRKGIKVNRSATGFPNKRLARKGYRSAKETAEITGEDTNIIRGRNGSFFVQKHYKYQSRNPKRIFKPKEVQQELDGFRRGETRPPGENELKSKLSIKSRTPWERGKYRYEEIPGENIKTKIDYTDGSGRVLIDPPMIPRLLK